MNVRCERCKAEYDFDENRIPSEGLAVKCSTCGLVFRVFKQVAQKAHEWLVRQSNGAVSTVGDLAVLQRWVVERRVNRNDELSVDGLQWQRLGTMSDLAPFFQLVESQNAPTLLSNPQMAAPVVPTAPNYSGGAPVPSPNFAPAPMAPVQTPWPQPQIQAAAASRGRISSQALREPAWSLDASHATDDDDDLNFGRPKRGKWIAIVMGALVFGALAVGVGKSGLLKQFFAPAIPELAINHVNSGYVELRRDSNTAIDKALENFQQAASLAPNFADAKAGLADAELARAEYLLMEVNELSGVLLVTPENEKAARREELEAKKKQGKEWSDKAFIHAKEAFDLAPDALATVRALADYYRFKNSLDQMKPLLEKAKKLSPNDPRVAMIFGSSQMSDPSVLDVARRYFETALEQAPDMQRARYKLALVYKAQNNIPQAMMQLRAILAAVPDHERAKALTEELEPPKAPPVPVVAPEPVDTAEPPVEEKPTVPKEVGVRQLVAQADRLRQSDKPQKALQLYEKAAEMEPDNPEIHTAIGWCYVDMEDPGSAVESFKDALKLAPRFTDAMMGLAEAYRLKGMKRDAIKYYQQYLDILPDGPEAPVAKRMLETLQ